MNKEQKITTLEVTDNRVSQQPQGSWIGWKRLGLSNEVSWFLYLFKKALNVSSGIQTSSLKPKDVLTAFLPLPQNSTFLIEGDTESNSDALSYLSDIPQRGELFLTPLGF